MRLSWNEIRARAAKFSVEWATASYEKGQTQQFYIEFFDVFGVPLKRFASFEKAVKKLGGKQGFMDLFWKGVLLVEQKSAGRDLKKAREQAKDYFPGLKDEELPRFLLLSDFQSFELVDLEKGTEVKFKLHELHKMVEHFGFIIGVQKHVFREQDPVNVKAAAIMGELHETLRKAKYNEHDLERLLVRLVFCLFADATGIFDRNAFADLVESSRPDGTDLGRLLIDLFGVLDTPPDERQTDLDEDLAAFRYINGDLFDLPLKVPAFNAASRNLLLKACRFKWDVISPAIFGSLFQSIKDDEERRKTGEHYTTEKNIMKVILPLFMDDLRAEFAIIKAKKKGRLKLLEDFQTKLGKLKFFDPACGCGNFLIIAYRELRLLEIEVLREMYQSGQLHLDVSLLSQIDVNQFYGIEIAEFPSCIAETALWMMDHIMNNLLSMEFGTSFARIPLKAKPVIKHADSLEIEWKDVIVPDDNTFILGNPPFIGAKQQSDEQRMQVRLLANLGGSGGTLDYVCAWFLKAGDFVKKTKAKIGFVATNSISQGELVPQFWPSIFNECELEISFAHKSFNWSSDAKGKAQVHVVIIGLVPRAIEPAEKRLFTYDDISGDPVESRHAVVSPYLFNLENPALKHLVIKEENNPINEARRLITGSQPLEDDNLTFDDEQKAAFIELEPKSKDLFRPLIGSKEFINGLSRWILHTSDLKPDKLKKLPHVVARLDAVREFRRSSKRKSTLAIAEMPWQYGLAVLPTSPFLAVPNVSSERREYIPMGWLEPPVIPNQKLRLLPDADLWEFAILTSRMHMAWTRAITGRMKSDYMYSVGICYNPFPWPAAENKVRQKVRELAQSVLNARNEYTESTLSDLYDPKVMPADLRKAHKALDAAVDKMYRKAGFDNDRDRVEFLFELYMNGMAA